MAFLRKKLGIIRGKYLSFLNPEMFLRVSVVIALSLSFGCKSHLKFSESKLPLPPGVDSGVYDGQFVQVDYGFGFPVPSKWYYVKLSADQEVDEVGRFNDSDHQLTLRISVQLRDPSEKFSPKVWSENTEQDLKNHQFKIKKKESLDEYKTKDSGNWAIQNYQLLDSRGWEWMDRECVLAKDDLLIGVHAMVPIQFALTEKGKKLFKAVEGSVTQIHWYLPIGSRGISVERFELQHFTEGFRQALESRSLSKTGIYFDEMYPERAKWIAWYQQVSAGDPKTVDLKAELSGLVINGDFATASFTVTRKDTGGAKPQKYEKSFKLSKKEGHWDIIAPVEK